MTSDAPSVKTARLNRSQALLHLINANTAYCLWPRAGGKTSGGIGPRIERLSEVMPRAQILLVSDKFERIHDVLMPGIESYLAEELGMIEGWDYVKFKRPPEHFARPLFPINKYDHVVTFSTGVSLCAVSLKVSGSANGYNAQALIGDEAKFFNEQKLKTEVLPAIRGGKKHFGELPEFQSKWYFTDKWGENIQWLLNKKKDIDWQKIDVVYTLALELERLRSRQLEVSSSSTWYELQARILQIERVITPLRRELVYYSDANAYENIEVLGEKFFRDLKRDLTEYEYEVAIENKDPDRTEKPFYPDLGKVHFYQSITDINPNKGLIIALDYQFRIAPVVTAQFDRLNGSPYTTLNFVGSLHSLYPQGMKDAVQKWCKTYEHHPVKLVYYVFDHTAIGRSPWGKTFKDLVTEELILQGWSVVEIFTGDAPDHHDKFESLKKWLTCPGDGAVRINELTNECLKRSLEKTGIIMHNGKTKKDKSSENSPTVPPEDSTHYPDTFDQIIWGALELELVPKSDDGGMDISTR